MQRPGNVGINTSIKCIETFVLKIMLLFGEAISGKWNALKSNNSEVSIMSHILTPFLVHKILSKILAHAIIICAYHDWLIRPSCASFPESLQLSRNVKMEI